MSYNPERELELRLGAKLAEEVQREVRDNPAYEMPSSSILTRWSYTEDQKIQYRFLYLGEGIEPVHWADWESGLHEDFFNTEIHTRLKSQDKQSFFRFCLTLSGAFIDFSTSPPQKDEAMFGFLCAAILPNSIYEL